MSASLAADWVSAQIESAPAETNVDQILLCSQPCDGSWPTEPTAVKSPPESRRSRNLDPRARHWETLSCLAGFGRGESNTHRRK